MSKLIVSIVTIIFSIVSLSLFAGTIDPNTPDQKYIDYGSKFYCIQKITGMYHNNTLYAASCVVIDPSWVLTAAHVVNNANISIVYEQEDKPTLVDKIICHELYQEKIFGYNDIALCHLKNPIHLDFYPALYEENNEVNKICCMSGYGFTGTFNTGIKIMDDKKRAGSNKIDYIDKHLLICMPSRVNKTELEFLIGVGDSGGGLFIDNKLAGINSCVIAQDGASNSSYGDESGHTRISVYRNWILDTIKKYDEKQ